MNKLILAGVLGISLLGSCVSARKYDELNRNYIQSQSHLKDCHDSSETLVNENTRLKIAAEELRDDVAQLKSDSTELNASYQNQKKLYDDLSSDYERLKELHDSDNRKNLGNLKDLEASLLERERKLREQQTALNQQSADNKALQADLNKKQSELAEKARKVKELEARIAAKDSLTKALKKSISDALTGFSDNEISVTIKEGKVYVSLSEQLLFASGSTVVDKKGQAALIQLGKALQSKPDINILVEGHTDDVPMHGEVITDNWDLSVLRATSITRILTGQGGIDPTRVIASGRSQYYPVAPGKSAESRKKNRRTEIILSPKLDELYKLLNQH